MPTVPADIKPVAVFPAPIGKIKVKRLSVYPAEHWEKWGGEPGLFRVMVGDAWLARKDERACFYDMDGLGEVLRRWGLGALGCDGKPDPLAVLPDTPKATPVWACDDPATPDLATRTRTIPFQDDGGFWCVWVWHRPAPVLLSNLALRRGNDGR